MKKTTLKVLIVVGALAVLGVGLVGYASQGFTNWSKEEIQDRFTHTTTEETSQTTDVTEEITTETTTETV